MTLIHGDCIEAMAAMEADSIDAICTDPPYGLEFIGKAWDRLGDIGTTSHGGPAEKAAGERGQYGRISNFGSANRKCRKCSKWQWDHVGRKCECERPDFPNIARHQGMLMQEWHEVWAREAYRVAKPSAYLLAFGGTRTVHRMTVALEDAGWIIRDMLVWAYASGFPKSKASLKPAWEPIVMARKPGPLRELAIDACRIGVKGPNGVPGSPAKAHPGFEGKSFAMPDRSRDEAGFDPNLGRWPSNVLLTSPIFDGGWDGVVGGGPQESHGDGRTLIDNGSRHSDYGMGSSTRMLFDDAGTYSRFFLIPKADRADREPVLGGLPRVIKASYTGGAPDGLSDRLRTQTERANIHPTVKPVDLMRHLVRLVTPTGGIVLDPFAGSGSTLLAAEMEGFEWIGIEKEAEYVAIAEARLNGTQRGLGLPA